MTRLLFAMLVLCVGTSACRRPIEPAPQPVALPQTTGPASPDRTPPTEPAPPPLTQAMVIAAQDQIHEMLDRSLGVALTMKSYGNRAAPQRLGRAKWEGATAHLETDGALFAKFTPRDLPCDIVNAGDWRRAWSGKGGAATTFELEPQWWQFNSSPWKMFVRVGATDLTAMVYDASRKCWTGETILVADRRRSTEALRGSPLGSSGVGAMDAQIYGNKGKLETSVNKISFFDGKNRFSFEPTDKATCAWVEWGKNEAGYWVWGRFSAGPQASRCPDDVDVSSEELLEIRDAEGELVRAVREWTPGAQAPVGTRSDYIRQTLHDVVLVYEGTEKLGAAEPPKEWDERCKAVHRDDLRRPRIPVASKQELVGLWSVQREGKDLGSAVGKRTVVEIDCLEATD